MKKYEILEHTADLKIRAWGKDKKEVFSNMLEGMQKAMRPQTTPRKTETEIQIKAEDLPSLLADFLSEINYLNEVKQEIYQKVFFDELLETSLRSRLWGKKVKRFGLQIKGVTFHQLEFKQLEDNSWQATVLFDI